jgi:AcrR family transcriptional regulator
MTDQTTPSSRAQSVEEARRNPARRSEASRRAIIDAAIDLVVSTGFEALSIEGIARRAGVGKQTIYRWWPSKGALFLDAFLERRVEQRADSPVLEPLDSGDLAADVRRLVGAEVAHLATPSVEAPYRALVVALQADPELAARASERLIRPSMARITDWLATAQRRGDVRTDLDLDVAAELLLGPLFQRWLLRTGPLDDAYADALAGVLLGVLAARG